MIFQAHKGVSTENPENTFPALFAAVEQGYGIIELDVGVTRDGEFVLLHDKTLARTARTRDGKTLSNEVLISDITYREALEYDLGLWFSKKFKGTRIPLFKDVLEFAREHGIPLKIDNKYEAFTGEQREAFYKLIAPFEDVACLTCKSMWAIREAAEIFGRMHFHYDGAVTEERLSELSSILPKERLTVWLPIKNKLTAWVKTDYASPELAALIKKHARLGVWILSDYSELAAAESLGAEVVETNGSIKPPTARTAIADMHTHSESSHDSVCPIEDMLGEQLKRGTEIFAVTDHFDAESHDRYDIYTPIEAAHGTVDMLRRKYPDATVLKGVEIGEGFRFPEVAERVVSSLSHDVIIGSVHLVRYEGLEYAYSKIDFGALSDEEIHAYLDAYFDDMLAMLEESDFDILAHMTCPVRYIKGTYGRSVDLGRFDAKIDLILKRVIASGKALEVNTSGIGRIGELMPGRDIIKRYRDMGGYLITVGSDAHVAENASSGFSEAIETLRDLGFAHIYYYKERKPIALKI